MHACLIHSKVTSFLLNGANSYDPSLVNVCALPETASDRRWAQDVTIKLRFSSFVAFYVCCYVMFHSNRQFSSREISHFMSYRRVL